jgi:peptidoglycan hydrolase CwlO-like protein
LKIQVRRSLIIAAAGSSVVMGGVAVQTAAAWVQSTIPANGPTLTAADLQDQLAAEEARSAALQAQVDALLAQAGQFHDALGQASDQIVGDVQQAAALRAELAAEQKRLAALKAAAKAAAAQHPKATPPPTHTTTGASGGSGDDGGD